MESLETLNQAWTNINTSYSNLLASVQTKKLAEELQDINMELKKTMEDLPDLVMLDISLPKIDGLAVAKKNKNTEKNKRYPCDRIHSSCGGGR